MARATFKFAVKEFGDGRPFIALEPQSSDGSVSGLPRGAFYLNLRPATTLEQAREVANACNSHVEGLSFDPK